MIPLRDDQGKLGAPWLTILVLLSWVGGVAWCWQLQGDELLAFIREMSLRPSVFRRGIEPFTWQSWRTAILPLLSHGFIHVGPVHLLASMAGLWLFGSRLEQRAGPLRYGLLLLLLQVAGGLGLCYFGAAAGYWYVGGSAPALSLGVSYLLLYPRAHASLWVPPWPLVCHLPVFVVWTILGVLQWPRVAKFFELRSGEPIDWRGLAVAAVAALVLGPLLVGKRRKPRQQRAG